MEILINKNQWQNVLKKDPKNIYSLTNRAIEFMNSSTLEKKPFYLQISHYAFIVTLNQLRKVILDLKINLKVYFKKIKDSLYDL